MTAAVVGAPDPIDRALIVLLREDARRTLADMAARVNLSPSAVRRRIDRLEAERIITGYTVTVDEARVDHGLDAFTELRFAGDAGVDEITAAADGIPEVRAIFTVAGDPDALVWVRVRDVADLKRVIDQFRRSGRVTGTKTMAVLGAWIKSGEPGY